MQHNKPFDPSKPVVVSGPADSQHTKSQSTGPRTEAGKQASSRNATKHGCCSEATLILSSENLEDYQALEATWFHSYHPQADAEHRLVSELVNADWFLVRANKALAEFENTLWTLSPDPWAWTAADHQNLARFTRYQTARTNTAAKARKAVEDYRRSRLNETIKTERHELYKAKNKVNAHR